MGFIKTFLSAINPFAYKELTEHKYHVAFKYFGMLMISCLLLMFLLFIPKLLIFPNQWNDARTHFNTLNVNIDSELKEPFNLMNDPLIRIDTENNMTRERFLITADGIYYRSFLLFGSPRLFAIHKQVDVTQSDRLRVLFGMYLLFIIPALFFWAFVGFTIYVWLIILITVLLAWIVLRILHRWHTFNFLCKSALYASTLLIVVQLITLPFHRFFLLPLILFWIFFILIIIVNFDTPLTNQSRNRESSSSHEHKKSTDIFSKKSEKKDIFADHGDTEEQGESSTKKPKKSFDEENDGYVVLK